MTREQCKAILPIIRAFAKGERVEFWDTDIIVGSFNRGAWRTAENIGFGCSVDYYRLVKKDGQVIYFGNKKK